MSSACDPSQDFLAVGVTPPEGLTIAYRGPSDRRRSGLDGQRKGAGDPRGRTGA